MRSLPRNMLAQAIRALSASSLGPAAPGISSESWCLARMDPKSSLCFSWQRLRHFLHHLQLAPPSVARGSLDEFRPPESDTRRFGHVFRVKKPAEQALLLWYSCLPMAP